MPPIHVLRDRLGPRLLIEDDRIVEYSRDASRAIPEGLPLAVVRAESTADVSHALAWANEHSVPVSIRGAGTGLSGGAVAYPNGLVISLERMTRIIEIDPVNRLAVVEAGVVTGVLDEAVAVYGLFFPPDPASARTSTVGGNIATNAGGLRCIAHGVTTDSVAALEVVLSDGRILTTGARTRKHVAGFDLKSLFTGSEGALGVITTATVRLKPIPAGTPRTFRASFDSVEDAGRAVVAVVNGQARPDVLELMDRASIEIIESFRTTGLAIPRAAILVGQTTGTDSLEKAEEITAMCTAQGAVEVAISASDDLLEARRLANPALTAQGLRVSCDVAVPIGRLSEVFAAIDEIGRRHGRRISTVAHAGDGNLHPTVQTFDESPEEYAAAELVIDEITRLALDAGGTITGEHGIGSIKLHELDWQFDSVARDVQHAIRVALDPKGILTPGRIV